MTIIDEDLLSEFRQPGPCEFCGLWCGQGTDPHHIRKRGIGGGSRLDIRINLVSLCRGFTRQGWKSCHQDAEAGLIKPGALWCIVAQREGIMVGEIEAEINRLLQAPKVTS